MANQLIFFYISDAPAEFMTDNNFEEFAVPPKFYYFLSKENIRICLIGIHVKT